MFKTLCVSFALVALLGCSSIPAYHPATDIGQSGFSEQKLSENQYRVMFQGDISTSRAEVEDYLLLRAAEITEENGYDYFVVSERNVTSKTRVVTKHAPAIYGRRSHLHWHDDYYFPYYAYGYDWGSPYDLETREYTNYSAHAYVTMYSGEKPVDNNMAFTASEVMDNLGPVECWNKQPHDEDKCKLYHPPK